MNVEISRPLPTTVDRAWLALVSLPFLFFFIGGLGTFAETVARAVTRVIAGTKGEGEVMFTGVSWLAVAWMCRPLRRGAFAPPLTGHALGAALIGNLFFTPLGVMLIWVFDHGVLMCMDRNYCASSVILLILVEWQFLGSLWRAMKRPAPVAAGRPGLRASVWAAGKRILFAAGLAGFYPCGWLFAMASGRGGDPGFIFLFGLLFLWLGWLLAAAPEKQFLNTAGAVANDTPDV
jgi:hypothetical protein